MSKKCSKQPAEKELVPIIDQEKPYWVSIFTMHRVMELRARKALRVPGTQSVFFDSNSGEYYDWLLPGWVAEERLMPHGRIYRYYYDPSGFQYDRMDDIEDAYNDMLRNPDPEELALILKTKEELSAVVGESSGVSDEKEEAPVV